MQMNSDAHLSLLALSSSKTSPPRPSKRIWLELAHYHCPIHSYPGSSGYSSRQWLGIRAEHIQFDQRIKSANHRESRIKRCIKAGSSDQEPTLTIKTFDRRRRSKYRAYSGDYPLISYVIFDPVSACMVQAD